jgi:hypothetical protein
MTLRLEYDLKFRDVVLFNSVHQFLSPLLQALYLVFAFFVFWSERLTSSAWLAAGTAAVFYCGMWFIQLTFNVAYLYSRHNKSVLTRHILEVQDDGLLEETPFNKSLFYWPGVVKVVSRIGFAAVYVSSQQAHVIPSRAFASGASRDKFITAVRAKISAAK